MLASDGKQPSKATTEGLIVKRRWTSTQRDGFMIEVSIAEASETSKDEFVFVMLI